ncbi:hypothetical protein ES707_05436 [subsurface metagenome]
MSITAKEKPKTPKFKINDSVIIKNGGYGIVLRILPLDLYRVGFPDGHAFVYTEDELTAETKKDTVIEIMAIFKNDRLNPVSRIDRSYVRGWLECEYYRETITLEQRDELYQKMGIE